MTRRGFLGAMGAAAAAAPAPEISITMDDAAWMGIPQPWQAGANRALLETFERRGVRVALFAAGKNVDNPEGRAILESWNAAGHMIGNHTYSHRNYHAITFEEFRDDLLRGEAVVKPYSRYTGYFRFPVLKEGDTGEKRDRMREFLDSHGMHNGQVTVDASDWYYDARLRERLKENAPFDPACFRRAYIEHLWSRALFYDGLARDATGRSPRHTLLVHYNLINVLFLGDVMDHFRKQGWKWVSAADAFRDPIFEQHPKILPAGESLVWALAKEKGGFEKRLRYPGEDGDYEKAAADAAVKCA